MFFTATVSGNDVTMEKAGLVMVNKLGRHYQMKLWYGVSLSQKFLSTRLQRQTHDLSLTGAPLYLNIIIDRAKVRHIVF